MCSTAASLGSWRRRIPGSIVPIEELWLQLWLGVEEIAPIG